MRAMSPRPVIFISAVSSELKTARQLVANTLTFLGYEPEWQDIFGAEEGDLRAMLRRRIDASAGVVALIGQRYGAEPLEPDAQFGRVSYTQYEALYARKAGKKVWPLLLDKNFLTDPCNPESDELRALQHACRERIRADIHLYQPLTDSTALEATILKLRDDLGQLRRGVKQWALTVIALLIVLIAAAAWLVQSQRQQSHAVSALLERNQKVEHALIRLAEVEMNQKQPGEKLTADEQRGRAYATLEKDLSLSPGSLAKELPAFALELYSSPEASLLLRARAAYALNKFDEAEKLSFQFAGQERAVLEKAVQTADESRHSAIAALELAGQSAQKQIRWPRALEHLQAAAALTSRERDPEEWARVQHAIASVLYDLGRAREVEAILREVVAERARTLGPEHPDTLKSWSDLANALDVQGKYAEAEREDRALLAIRERIFGPTNLNTVKSRGNLGVVAHGNAQPFSRLPSTPARPSPPAPRHPRR